MTVENPESLRCYFKFECSRTLVGDIPVYKLLLFLQQVCPLTLTRSASRFQHALTFRIFNSHLKSEQLNTPL